MTRQEIARYFVTVKIVMLTKKKHGDPTYKDEAALLQQLREDFKKAKN